MKVEVTYLIVKTAPKTYLNLILQPVCKGNDSDTFGRVVDFGTRRPEFESRPDIFFVRYTHDIKKCILTLIINIEGTFVTSIDSDWINNNNNNNNIDASLLSIRTSSPSQYYL